MIERFRENFREEAYELLNTLEGHLMHLEEDPSNGEVIAAVFRSMHTIKGSAAMFGFDRISSFTHEVESVLDLVRNGKLSFTRELTGLTLRTRDHIRDMLEAGESVPDELNEISETLMNEYRKIAGTAGQSEPKPDVKTAPTSANTDKEHEPENTYLVRFTPNATIFENGTNPLLLLNELKGLGEFSCIPYMDRLPELSGLDAEKCYVSWDIILTTRKGVNDIRDVFIFLEDSAIIDVKIIERSDLGMEGPHKLIGQILVDRGVIDSDSIERIVHSQKRLGQLLVEDAGVNPSVVQSALDEQDHLERARTRARERVQSELAASTIRVSSEKLDQQVDLVGELVTLQARLSQSILTLGLDGQITAIAESLERLTAELRDSTMSMRMLPIGTTFSKFKRLVRDLSNELEKDIELEAVGGETELDKTVIERLNDPLIHIIRNSIDHGIERPEQRVKDGKLRTGTIRLAAAHAGAFVQISISDNGAGLDVEKIRSRAIERGLVSKDVQLSDDEIIGLIFAPGFSTADVVTKVSGRGVGMDVVRKEIENLGGSVQIQSQRGEGMTTTLNIPLTLAIIEGLLVEIGGDRYVFPLAHVTECIELTEQMRGEHRNRRMIENRGELLPYVSLREIFAIKGDAPDIQQIVVANMENRKIGFVVDSVIGDYQTVIKSLGKVYHDARGLSGATILGDGSVALILDIPQLSQIAMNVAETSLKR